MADYSYQSNLANLAYSHVLESCLNRPIDTGAGKSYVSKMNKGSRYWYLQTKFAGKSAQKYLGRETEELLQSIHEQEVAWENAKAEADARKELVSSAIAAGSQSIQPVAFKMLKALEEAGLFRNGGVLIGSFAFQSYANMLGVRWSSNPGMTDDLDLGADRTAIALPSTGSAVDIIRSVEPSLSEIPTLNRKSPPTSFSMKYRGAHFKVDFLTPMKGPTSSKPRKIPAFQAYAEPLRFLDYLIDGSQPTVLLYREGITVNVPSPGRFAIHKLMTSDRRPAFQALKSKKDLKQADLLLRVLIEDRPGDVINAIKAAKKYGSNKLVAHIKSAATRLSPDISSQVANYLSNSPGSSGDG